MERIGEDMSDGDGRSKLCEYEHEMSILGQLDDAEKTIEAQQQEIEQLKTKNDVLENDHINLEMNLSNVTADLDEQAGRIMRLMEALEEATETIENMYGRETPQTEKYRKILGGEEE
jgi:predicted  nucleic acid-binding Zn-ribbon protein